MKKLVVIAVFITALGINELVRTGPIKLLPSLPGTSDAPSWLKANCRGPGRDVERCKATIEALDGSGQDAIQLAARISPDDQIGRFFWLHIAAENGNAEAMRYLAQALAELPDEIYGRAHRIRARFWLERAVQAGDPEAQKLLTHIPPVSKAEAAAYRVPNATNPNSVLICGPMPWWRLFAVLWGDIDARLDLMKGSSYLSCKEVLPLEESALRGERDEERSARKLGFFLSVTQQDQNPTEGLYWERIGSENGDAGSKYNLGAILASAGKGSDGNPDHRVRGQYWLRKANAEGFDLAKYAIENVSKADLTKKWLTEEP